MFEGGKFNNKKELTFGVLIVLVSVSFVLATIWWIVDVIRSADKTVLAAIIAGLVGVFSLIFTYWKERNKSIKEAHREKKIEVYSKFFDIMFELMKNIKDKEMDEETATKNAVSGWSDITRGVLFYGSPNVLMSFSDFRVSSANNVNPLIIMRAMGKIILAMREDIGLSNKGLDELSVHQVYVNDDIRKMELLHEHP